MKNVKTNLKYINKQNDRCFRKLIPRTINIACQFHRILNNLAGKSL